MNKKLCAGLLLIGGAGTALADDSISHTFFFVRPHFQSGSPEREMMFRDDRVNMAEDGCGGTLEIVGYGSATTESCEFAKYFMPFGKTSLNVSEFKANVPSSQLDTDSSKNIEAANFNIATQSATSTFKSTIKFAPKQNVAGIGFAWKQTFWWCEDKPKAWLEVAFPVEHVRNRMRLSELITSTGGSAAIDSITGKTQLGLDGAPVVASMTEAFKQSNWKYGKIDNKKCHSKWGVADVEVKLNWSSVNGDCCNMSGYVGFVIPTGTTINAKQAAYMFNSVVGNNHHWGFLFGGHMDFGIWENDNHAVHMKFDAAGRILAKNNQVRSFDLKDKQWGRFLSVYNSFAQATTANTNFDQFSGTSGINVFTKCVSVSPRYTADSNTALVYTYCNWSAELGYNLYVREAEKICLNKWDETVAIKSVLGDGATSLARNISKNFTGSDLAYDSANFTSSLIKKSDLNLDSASHPAIISNTIYGGLGYDWETCGYPVFLGLGGSYEFSSVNTTTNRWTAWGKLGVSY